MPSQASLPVHSRRNVLCSLNLTPTVARYAFVASTSRAPSQPKVITIPEEPHMLAQIGYYPMQLGQMLQSGKYEIVRKLGFGPHSSVWLTKMPLEHGHTYVVVKILSTGGTRDGHKRSAFELQLARRTMRLSQSEMQHPGYKHCAIAQDVFQTNSAYGTHDCVVYIPYGQNLRLFRSSVPGNFYPFSAAKRLIRQVLLALDYMHNVLGVVHGDVRWDNVLTKVDARVDDVDRLLCLRPSETYPPFYNKMLSPDPIVTIRSQPLPAPQLDPHHLDGLEVCLTDYTGSCPVNETGSASIHTREDLKAPEMLLGHPWGPAADIWALGCLVSVIHYLRVPGAPIDIRIFTGFRTKGHLANIVFILGDFPPDFLGRCTDDAKRAFDADGEGLTSHGDISPEHWMVNAAKMNESKIPSEHAFYDTARFIRRCLTIDPEERPSAAELLEDRWLAS
ncbi:kinase-like domain-containing protein [Trametes polyzona]|nr:kinase-like domain-containing protein [Trametes polyzona]